MRYFYEIYPDAVICPQVEDELITDANMPTIEEIEAELKLESIHTKSNIRLE